MCREPLTLVRAAVKEDSVALKELIEELRKHQNLSEAPKITAKALEEDGFGENAWFKCEVAEIGGKVIGFCLYFNIYCTWEGRAMYMEDLYVKPEYRERGIGTKLWKSITEKALRNGCKSCFCSVMDWNYASIQYSKNKGAEDLSTKDGLLQFSMNKPEMEAFIKKQPDTRSTKIELFQKDTRITKTEPFLATDTSSTKTDTFLGTNPSNITELLHALRSA